MNEERFTWTSVLIVPLLGSILITLAYNWTALANGDWPDFFQGVVISFLFW
jgi:hypothetical protein